MEHLWKIESDYDSLPTPDNQAFSEDRVLPPRGNTPLLKLPKEGLPVPLTYAPGPPNPTTCVRPEDRSEEFFQLIRRGATRAMCEEFSLEFTEEKGIVAWMNQDIMDEFAGPAMDQGDRWKIYLGRRLKLDEDDPDGTLFIEGLLEDGIICHPRLWDRPRWVTVKEKAKTWATLPNPNIDNPLEFDHDWYSDGQGSWPYFCLVDPATDIRTEIPESQEHGDPDSDEEVNRQPQIPALQNAYDLEDDADLSDSQDGENGDELVAMSDPTLDLGIGMEDGDDDDMEWEGQSTDPSSCDSDFYDSE
ncbi:hypothetical protein NMY22_g14011 [Coprinellus aureogranulatus]|nr:hypothetical protein NMY22_g14011 [Coprinellus aureogranulatus]